MHPAASQGKNAGPELRMKVKASLGRGTPATKSLLHSRRHVVVRFAAPPGEQERQRLEQQGAEVLSYVPDQALLVALPEESRLDASVGLVEPIVIEQKLSPALLSGAASPLIVEFHKDVPRAVAQRILAAEHLHGHTPSGLRPHHLFVEASVEQARALAAWDEVAYLFPAPQGMLSRKDVVACVGLQTENGEVAQYASRVGEGWDGAGRNAVTLRYAIGAIPAWLPQDAARGAIQQALQEWSRVAKVEWVAARPGEEGQKRTVNISFHAGDHGDTWSFDGPGGTLAHTFYPAPPNSEPLAGDVHFDADEPWALGADTDLYSVALHEIGHALGLSHSDVPGSVMYPYYQRVFQLSADDEASIQAIYTANTAAVPLRVEPSVPSVLTQAAATEVMATVYGGEEPVRVLWSTNHQASGEAGTGRAITVRDVPLPEGATVITITAIDATGQHASSTVRIERRAQPSVPTEPAPQAPAPQQPAPQEPSPGPQQPEPSPAPPVDPAPQTPEVPAPAPAEPTLLITSQPAATTTDTNLFLSGTASHASGIAWVGWTSKQGMAGTANGSQNWTTGPIPLSIGGNEISIVTQSQAGTRATRTVWVERKATVETTDTTAPSITVQTPSTATATTTASSYIVTGVASDNRSVVQVTWSTTTGRSGTAEGTANWTTAIPLLVGRNTITVRASDAAGNATRHTITITRR